jgi:hypothetical protein
MSALVSHRRGAYRVLVGITDRKRPLGKPRRRYQNNFKTDLQEVGWLVMDYNVLAQDRVRWRAFVIVIINLRVP